MPRIVVDRGRENKQYYMTTPSEPNTLPPPGPWLRVYKPYRMKVYLTREPTRLQMENQALLWVKDSSSKILSNGDIAF